MRTVKRHCEKTPKHTEAIISLFYEKRAQRAKVFGRETVFLGGLKIAFKNITTFLGNDAQMDPNWVPKPHETPKTLTKSLALQGASPCLKHKCLQPNIHSVGGGDDTPHGVFD